MTATTSQEKQRNETKEIENRKQVCMHTGNTKVGIFFYTSKK